MSGPGFLSLTVFAAALCLNHEAALSNSAQPPAPVIAPASLDALIADLGAADLAVRESATAQLAARVEFPLAELEARLKRPNLTPEQRVRLLSAARTRFIASPRAALGVQFDSLQPMRAVISRTFPNFPAAAVLQKDDEIVKVAGQDVSSTQGWAVVRPKILCRDPGETLDMVVRRNGELVPIAVPLGRFNDLPQARFDAYDVASAWAERSATCTPPLTTLTFTPTPGDDAWHPGTAAFRGPRAVDASGMFAIGAHARGGRPMPDIAPQAAADVDIPGRIPGMPGINPRAVMQQEVWINGRRVQVPQNNQGVVVIGPNGVQEIQRAPNGVDAALINEYQRLIMSRAQLEAEIMMLAQRLGDPRLADPERAAAQELVQKRQVSLREVQQRLEIIEARLRREAQQQPAPPRP